MKILFVLLFTLMSSANAEIYRWVDENGNVVFSDESQDDAEQIELSPTTVYTPQSDSDETGIETKIFEQQTPGENTPPVPDYQLKVITPSNGESIWANDGNVTITVLIEPSLDVERADNLSVTLDGKTIVAEPGKSSVQFGGLSRGPHTGSAAVISVNGSVISASVPIQFYLHRASVLKKAK